jgi:hypothetical protein
MSQLVAISTGEVAPMRHWEQDAPVGGNRQENPEVRSRARVTGHGMLDMQRAAGNRAVAAYLGRQEQITVQRALGFELEMLALVDDNGGPADEKKPFGAYHNLTLDVDHSGEVATTTPRAAAQPDAPDSADGSTRETYNSIVELVTPAYPPENPQQAQTLLNDIRDAQAFASGLDLTNRVPASNLPGITTNDRTARYHVGNPSQGAQTTAASWQATAGIRLSQIGPLFDRLVGQARFVNKHQSDTALPGHVAKEGMVAARRVAASTVNANGFEKHVRQVVEEHYHNVTPEQLIDDLGGFLTLVSEYIRMGQQYGPSGTPKNIVTVLSRTDLSEVMRKLKDDYPYLYEKSTRESIIDMLTDTENDGISGQAALRNGDSNSMTVRAFLENVFHDLNDGVTNAFIGFRRLPMETVNETTGEQGPVVEIRNIAKPTSADQLATDRFAVSEWLPLAQYFVDMIAQLNTSPDTRHYDPSAVDVRHPKPTESQAPQGAYQPPTGNGLKEMIENFASTGGLRQGTRTVVRALPTIYGDQ